MSVRIENGYVSKCYYCLSLSVEIMDDFSLYTSLYVLNFVQMQMNNFTIKISFSILIIKNKEIF